MLFVYYCRHEDMIPKVMRLASGYVLCLLSRQSALTNKLQYICYKYHVLSHKVQLEEGSLIFFFYLAITTSNTKFFAIFVAL